MPRSARECEVPQFVRAAEEQKWLPELSCYAADLPMQVKRVDEPNIGLSDRWT